MATQRKRPRAYSSPACYLHELSPAHKAAHRGDIQIKRIYDEADAADGLHRAVALVNLVELDDGLRWRFSTLAHGRCRPSIN